MCGITGIFSYADKKPIDPAELTLASNAMFSRGPDDNGTWLHEKGFVGFAHRRLSIIDLSTGGRQPMLSVDGKYCIVFNGEIYNFLELKKDLIAKGHIFASSSDTEVLLYSYMEYGEGCTKKLRGMFAFAVWDNMRGCLFLARDHFGMKPLYYADDGAVFRFASQVKALCAMKTIDMAPDPAGHCGFFVWGHVPDPHSLFKNIRAVPSGESMVIDREGRKKNTAYFVLSDLLTHPGECPVSISDRKSLLYNSLSTSVVSHLFADVPVAIFLSAGIDSSIITALATESGKSAISTLTLGFEEFKGTPSDETLFAKEVALHYSTIHKTIEVPSTDFFNEFERIISAMDQPTIDGVNSYFICKAAKEAHIKVTLSGLGGDELFGGYPSFRRVPQFASLMRRMHVPDSIGKCFRALTYPLARMAQLYKYPGMFEYGNNYARLYLLQRSLSMPWEIRPLFDNSFFKQGTAELLSDLDQLHIRSTDIKSDFLKIAFFELNCYMKNQLLRDSDWASMAHSIELRLPFIDIEVIKTVASLDHLGDPMRKRDVALLAKKPLPESVLNRKKTGFTIPVEEWASSKARTRRKYKEMNYRHWACRVHDAYLKSVGVDPSPFFRADAVGKWE